MKILTSQQFRYLDAYTIEHEPITSLALMERAATRFSLAFTERWDASRPVVVFAGSGNNGGDALAVSRMLAAKGYEVEAFLFNTGKGLSADCAANKEQLATTSVRFKEVTNEFQPPRLTSQHIVIDGLFGTGLSRSLSGGFAAVVRYINNSSATVVSIDMPSGLMAEDNTDNNMAHVVKADYTFTFHAPKLSFLLADYAPYVGHLEVLDISLMDPENDETDCEVMMLDSVDFQKICPSTPRTKFVHKGQMGHALLVAGSKGMAGAAILSARSTLRSGVGKLTVVTPDENRPMLQVSVPEAVVTPREEICEYGQMVSGFSAIGVGPGIGTDDQAADLLLFYLRQVQTEQIPLVLDADALNVLAHHRDWIQQIPEGSVLTPHRREMERLLGVVCNSFQLIQNARELAIRLKICIVLKGAYTQVIAPDGTTTLNPSGNSGMATAGSGDVLTGIILGLMTRGYTSVDAARLGVYLHGLAGDFAADKLGEESLIASDITQYLPVAFKSLLK